MIYNPSILHSISIIIFRHFLVNIIADVSSNTFTSLENTLSKMDIEYLVRLYK